jgi:hypothetical protein
MRGCRATINTAEVAALRYINDEYWTELSGDSRLAVDGAGD